MDNIADISLENMEENNQFNNYISANVLFCYGNAIFIPVWVCYNFYSNELTTYTPPHCCHVHKYACRYMAISTECMTYFA